MSTQGCVRSSRYSIWLFLKSKDEIASTNDMDELCASEDRLLNRFAFAVPGTRVGILQDSLCRRVCPVAHLIMEATGSTGVTVMKNRRRFNVLVNAAVRVQRR